MSHHLPCSWASLGIVPEALAYVPYFCEENVWQLCQHQALEGRRCHVLFISNPIQECLFMHQRVAAPGKAVVWDYHVVLLVQDRPWYIVDLDTKLPCPLLLTEYIRKTFPKSTPPEYHPLFRCVERKSFIENFASNRQHMRHNGRWLQKPPPWTPPKTPWTDMNLPNFISMEEDFLGEVLTTSALLARFSEVP